MTLITMSPEALPLPAGLPGWAFVCFRLGVRRSTGLRSHVRGCRPQLTSVTAPNQRIVLQRRILGAKALWQRCMLRRQAILAHLHDMYGVDASAHAPHPVDVALMLHSDPKSNAML